MSLLTPDDLKLVAGSVKDFFGKSLGVPAEFSASYLGENSFEIHEFTGVIGLSGQYAGNVVVSAARPLLRETLIMQGEHDLSDENLLDAVGEIANTVAGNARRHFGAGLEISPPAKLKGEARMTARVRSRPLIVQVRWASYSAQVVIDMEKKV